MIFKNWLETRSEMEMHEPNVYLTILGGVLRGFWSLLLDWSTRSAIFCHLKTDTFGKALTAPQSKNGLQTPRETPPRMVYKTIGSCV